MRQEKLNGRPPKEQHKKRSYQVNVKLMTEEYYYLKSQASKAAMPINDYVRSAIRSKEVRQRLIPELNLHIRELCGMANNINQLAKKANQAGFTTVSLECSVFMEMIDDIIQRIRMMAKITCGGDFRGAVNYILDDRKRAEIIGSDGLRLRDKESIISSFTMQQELRPDISKPVYHISLDFSVQDKDLINNGFIDTVAREYMERMGINNTQYFVARHFDREHPHVHICINRIDNDGKLISTSNDRKRSTQICKELTLKHGLYMASGKENVKRHRLKEPDKSKYEIYDALRTILPLCQNWDELALRLQAKGVDVTFKTKGSTSQVEGIRFTKNGITFSGSKIDRMYSYSKINACFSQQIVSIEEAQSFCSPRQSQDNIKQEFAKHEPVVGLPKFGGFVADDNSQKRCKKKGQQQ